MKLAAAACHLRLAASTVALLSRTGQLEVDAETDGSGARFVTRASVRNYWMARDENTRLLEQRAGGAGRRGGPLTGHTTSELMDLVRAGVLQQIPGRCRVE
jgi:hypothetical protein